MSGPASRFSAAVAKTSAARCKSSAFHCVIWLGWTSNRSANCTSVCSPLMAASATFALKAAEWLRRGRLILSAPSGHPAHCRRDSTYLTVQNSGAPSTIHIDTKKLGRIERPSHRVTGNRRDIVAGAGWEMLFVAIDDHARIGYTEMLPDETK